MYRNAEVRVSVFQDVNFSLVLSQFLKEFNGIMEESSDKWTRNMKKLNKDMGDAIRESRVWIEPDMTEGKKGGVVVIKMKGTDKEINKWCHMGWKAKFGYRAYRPVLKVEVVK